MNVKEMIIVPEYVLVAIPALSIWWTHRRGERKEYGILAISFLTLFIPLMMLAHNHPRTCTRYEGPLAATGINTIQIPLALLATSIITAIPVKIKLVRNFGAFVIGELLIWQHTWIS